MSQLDSMLQQMGDHLESHSKPFKEAVLLKKIKINYWAEKAKVLTSVCVIEINRIAK